MLGEFIFQWIMAECEEPRDRVTDALVAVERCVDWGLTMSCSTVYLLSTALHCRFLSMRVRRVA